MSTILVTGASGFVGATLFGMAARAELGAHHRFVPLPEAVDLREPDLLRTALRGAQYDAVIHLAAISFVPESIERPYDTYAINLHGTINLFEALKAQGFRGTFLYVSSGDVYGVVPPEVLPVSEERVPRPRNPYAAAKLAAEAYCQQASVTSGARFVVARPFNHIGAGQSERFFLPAMARQMLDIKQGKRPPHIDAGNIDVTRDFSDVRDVVQAYVRLLEAGRSGEVYNVCSGVERNIGGVLRRMLVLAGIEAIIEVDEDKLRPNEQRRHCGSNRKLCDHTGWQPRIPFEQSLLDLLQSWSLI